MELITEVKSFVRLTVEHEIGFDKSVKKPNWCLILEIWVYYKLFTIVIYDHNYSTIVIYDHNDIKL